MSTWTAVDQAYRAKYGRYGSAYVAPMTADAAARATVRLTPAQRREHTRHDTRG